MPITVTIKNLSSKPITLAAVDPPVTVEAGKEAGVPLDAVRSAEFGEHLAAGAVALSRSGLDALSPEIRSVVVQAVGDVILRVAPRFVAHHVTLTSAIANLVALRDRYNELHGSTVKLLGDATKLAGGAKSVVAAIDVSASVEDDAVIAAEEDLAEHLTKVPKNATELKAWFDDHKRLEAAVAGAKTALAAAKNAVARQLEATRTDLVAAAAMFEKADPAKDVGPKLTWGS